jgi:hypothetical protein
VPNRGLEKQTDIRLNGVPYVQAISDVTNPATGKGDALASPIHFEPGLWVHVPATTIGKLFSFGDSWYIMYLFRLSLSPGQVPSWLVVLAAVGMRSTICFARDELCTQGSMVTDGT